MCNSVSEPVVPVSRQQGELRTLRGAPLKTRLSRKAPTRPWRGQMSQGFRPSECAADLLAEREAALILGVKPRWLQLDRCGARRVPFVRPSRRTIRYLRSDLTAFLARSRVEARP